MKRKIVLAALGITWLIWAAIAYVALKPYSLVGEWRLVDPDRSLIMKLTEDGTVIMNEGAGVMKGTYEELDDQLCLSVQALPGLPTIDTCDAIIWSGRDSMTTHGQVWEKNND